MSAEDMNLDHKSNIYKQKGEVWFDDGREERLLEYVNARLPLAQVQPEEVIALIDEFGVRDAYMMNVGSQKGSTVTDLIAKHKPKVMVELGGYVGYSTILFATALRKNGGQQYISFEREPKFAKVSGALVALAGLSDVVRIVVGSSSRNLVVEHNAGRLSQVDMMFIDHYKPAYIRDLKICESLGLIRPGTVLAADNVIQPGNPTYLEYVRSTPEEKRARLEEDPEAQKSRFPLRTANQYKEYEKDDTYLPGDPGIVYESTLVPGDEPTGIADGVEVTICKSIP